jgi:hypothetical protein
MKKSWVKLRFLWKNQQKSTDQARNTKYGVRSKDYTSYPVLTISYLEKVYRHDQFPYIWLGVDSTEVIV